MSRTKLTLVFACLCALAVAAAPAQARRSTYYTQYEVSIQGEMTEKWSKTTTHGEDYGCPAREEESGGATIRFATVKPKRVTAGPYTGWHGRPLLRISDDRYGQFRTLNADGSAADCGVFRPAYDGSACGHREWTGPVTLFNTRNFGFDFPADDPKFPFECPYPDKPPAWGGDNYWDSGYVLSHYASDVDWFDAVFASRCNKHGRHCKPPRKVNVIHNVKHVSLPYASPKYPGAFEGSYEADIDWTATVRRLEKVHVGR
jgi:hypothetical protein